MKTKIQYILILVALFLLSVVFKIKALAKNNSQPHIYIENVPIINNGSNINGYIWSEDGKVDFAEYRITMALEITSGSKIWAPKPTYNQPFVEINSSGYFTCTFVTGGEDSSAQKLYVSLIKKDFIPNYNFEQTKNASIDLVTIERSNDGKITINQSSPSYAIKKFDLKNPSKTKMISINYSPYVGGLSPKKNDFVEENLMREQIKLLKNYADTIRIFDIEAPLDKVCKIAKKEFGLRIIGGCWIDKYSNNDNIYSKLDQLIKTANDGLIDIAVVGSECIYRGDFSAEQLSSYINYVRNGIINKNIPVCTSDTATAFLNNPKLIDVCDVILFTSYPFFDKYTAELGAKQLEIVYNQVKEKSGIKPIIISETGFPTEGSPEGDAIPSTENAKKYFEDVYKWSRIKNVEVVFFSAFDEEWKTEGSAGDIGMHWGHFNSQNKVKKAYKDIYNKITGLSSKVFSIANNKDYFSKDIKVILDEEEIIFNSPPYIDVKSNRIMIPM